MMPTFQELSGSKVKVRTDGISLVPALLSKKGQKTHPYLYGNFTNKEVALQSEKETGKV